MPKQRITKEMVVDAAFELARSGGMEAVLVKSIAARLGCSVQPIYSYCSSMDGLRAEVTDRARSFIQAYVGGRINPQDMFRSTGRAYVQAAKQEPHLFRLYIAQERKNIASLADLYRAETDPRVPQMIAQGLHITEDAARELHLHMLIYTIGTGTVFSSTSGGISEEEIFHQQEEAYRAFSTMILEENKNEP